MIAYQDSVGDWLGHSVRWFESTYSITKMWWFELPLRLLVRFHSLRCIKVWHLPHLGQGYVIMSKLRRECGYDIHYWISHWMSGCGAHTKNISYILWEHYSHYNNIAYQLFTINNKLIPNSHYQSFYTSKRSYCTKINSFIFFTHSYFV